MQAYIKTLRNHTSDIIYPRTLFKAIIDPETGLTLQEYINNLYFEGYSFGGCISSTITQVPKNNTFYVVPAIEGKEDATINIYSDTVKAKYNEVSIVTYTSDDSGNGFWKVDKVLQLSSDVNQGRKSVAASEASIRNLNEAIRNLGNIVSNTDKTIANIKQEVIELEQNQNKLGSRRFKCTCNSLADETDKIVEVNNILPLYDNDIIYLNFYYGVAQSTSFNLTINDNINGSFVSLQVIGSPDYYYDLSLLKKNHYYAFIYDKSNMNLCLTGEADTDTPIPLADDTTDGLLSKNHYTVLKQLVSAKTHKYIQYNPSSTLFNVIKQNDTYTTNDFITLLNYCLRIDSSKGSNYHFVFNDMRPDNTWITTNNPILPNIWNNQGAEVLNNRLLNLNVSQDDYGNIVYGGTFFNYEMSFVEGEENVIPTNLRNRLKHRIEESLDHKFHMYFDLYNISSADENIELSFSIQNSRGDRVKFSADLSEGGIASLIDSESNKVSTIEIVFTCLEYEHPVYESDYVTPSTPYDEVVFNSEIILHHNNIIG